ncbi:hypothetical protein [Saccharomonospora sp. CUA-673]|uniref:hypothetical protein n=1 Tax=Saccharomonospora sp. CUA-673 TaxID=1904969 RepID=UPI00130150CD|nr:hypothetical protein [Saccharomonospora sp. CUA-673]
MQHAVEKRQVLVVGPRSLQRGPTRGGPFLVEVQRKRGRPRGGQLSKAGEVLGEW